MGDPGAEYDIVDGCHVGIVQSQEDTNEASLITNTLPHCASTQCANSQPIPHARLIDALTQPGSQAPLAAPTVSAPVLECLIEAPTPADASSTQNAQNPAGSASSRAAVAVKLKYFLLV